ncbi:hypothetical protein Ate01nite_43770 [Actinoplanes teichomyceticus]|nr:hypothetical protein Ate01nite_43770 [Actinoplanes teichomyceticus]
MPEAPTAYGASGLRSALSGTPAAGPVPGVASPGTTDRLDWPAEKAPPARADWRDRLTLATDLALIGIAVTALALPVVTAPAALAAGSAAVHDRCRDGRLPGWRPVLRQFRRGILPGVPALSAAAALLIDLIAVRGGGVPGGPVLFAVTGVVAVWLSGVAALTLVALGRAPDRTWRAAAAWAWDRPKCATALAVTGVIAFFLALAVPVTLPLVIGFHLFAIHMISDRLAR